MKFGYTIFYVANVPKTLDFYTAAFGLKQAFLHESELYGELDTGATTLAFAADQMAELNGLTIRPNRADALPAACEIAFVTDDPRAAYDHATAAGAMPVAEPAEKPWGQTVAYVRDLNGCLVELCSPIP